MSRKINVFLPMRAGSERVFKKNTKTFSGIQGGLCRIKLEQLVKCDLIEEIFVSTNDPEVVEISNSFQSEKIKVVIRPIELATSSASTDDLIKYTPEIMPNGHILWTHVTSPFISSDIYCEIIKAYFKNLDHFDSLMTVTKLQKFIWNESKPINYDRNLEKWPKTQTIEALWEVNSGAFLASKAIYQEFSDRIGNKPYFFELRDDVAFDIDWLSDYKIAEAVFYSTHSLSRKNNISKESKNNKSLIKQR